MTTRWLCVLLLVIACDQGQLTERAPATATRWAPIPPGEFVSIEEPTADTIRSIIGGWYSFPERHTVVADRRDREITWILYYDHVKKQMGASTSRQGDHFITWFTPEVSEPERPRREQLIGEAKALTAANVAGASQPVLVYLAHQENRTLEGGLHTVVVASWRLVYSVQVATNGAAVDAYTGEIVARWR